MQSIFISPTAGQAMQHVNQVLAVTNEGLLGDRYQLKKGYWDPVEGCQVTVITLHELSRAHKKSPMALVSGEHRRNLVIEAMHPRKLINQTIRIGEAVFQFHKPRPPCGYLDQLLMKGVAKALGNNSGFCFKVIQGGRLTVGDEVILID